MPRTPTEPRQGIACAGNWIVDVVHSATRWPEKGDLVRVTARDIGVGGGAANVLTDLASLGAPFPLAAIGCVGPDANGQVIRDHCARIGARTEGLRVLPDHMTAYDEVISVPGDSRTFFYHGGANDALTEDHVDIDALAEAGHRLFYLGYLMLLGELDRLEDGSTGAARLLARARAAGMVTCVDLVSDANPAFREIVAPALPHTDYLILNEIEAGRSAGVEVRDAEGRLSVAALHRAAEALIAGGVKAAVVIHAPEGALWAGVDEAALWRPVAPVSPDQITSPVGAGDAFCAAVLYGLHEGWAREAILRLAHLAAVACLGGATATDGIPPMATLQAHPDMALT